MKRIFKALFLLSAFIGLLCFPAEAAEAVREGLRICGVSVIPALFPFFVLTKYLIGSRRTKAPSRLADRVMLRCFGLSGNCALPLLLSFLGGYPVGASCAAEQYQKGAISKQEAERLLLFCNNSGPAFFLGVIGGVVLQNIRTAMLLYLSHVLAALCCGMLFRSAKAESAVLRRVPTGEKSGGGFLQAVSASCAALLQISGLILFFSALLAVFEASGAFFVLIRMLSFAPPQELRAVLCGFFELSSGIVRLTACENAPLLCSLLMGWGGICVHLQAMSFWLPCKLRPHGYPAAKLLHGALSVLFTAFFLSPTPALAAVAAGTAAVCAIFPQIRQKWGRNPARHTV